MNMDVKALSGRNGRILRCAAYVRKSTEDGLELEYNSLDAQYDAISSYVRSQACNGWVLIDKKYADGGFSGGNTERPGLQALLADIQAGLVDIVVVYKIDRLSRSIMDFADLSKLFDQYRVSFVSVTQQIDTSTAAGRMMLNILISFSQFEREQSADRVRDKIRASKERGLWVGGRPPFGYKAVDKKLVPDPENAAKAQRVFELFAKHGELRMVCRALKAEGIERDPGRAFRPRSVYNVVHNRRYVGELEVGGKIVKTDHPALISQPLWEKVQKRLAEQPVRENSGRPLTPQSALLRDVLYCGNCKARMIYAWCTSGRNAQKRYGYYECQHLRGRAADCTVKRVPSALVEAEVEHGIRNVLASSLSLAAAVAKASSLPQAKLLSALVTPEGFAETFTQDERHALVEAALARASVFEDKIELVFKTYGVKDYDLVSQGCVEGEVLRVNVAISFRNVSGVRRVYRLDGESKPITSAALDDNPLLTTVVRAFAWLKLLDEGKVRSIPELCKLTGMDAHFMYRTLRLATLSPKIIRAIISGNEPDGLSLGKIRHLTTDDWSEQERILGFAV